MGELMALPRPPIAVNKAPTIKEEGRSQGRETEGMRKEGSKMVGTKKECRAL